MLLFDDECFCCYFSCMRSTLIVCTWSLISLYYICNNVNNILKDLDSERDLQYKNFIENDDFVVI